MCARCVLRPEQRAKPEQWWGLLGSPVRRPGWLETGGCVSGETLCAVVTGEDACVKVV